MIGSFVRLEASRWFRDRRVLATLVGTALALTLAAVWATAEDISRQEAHLAASTEARDAWEAVGDIHAHSMAHFGDYVFRPSGPLAQLDRGVQSRLGKVLRIEAHRMGAPLFADADEAGPLARYARPDAAFLLQVVVPLLLIFLGGTGLAADRESGRLKLSLVQGARGPSIVLGRALALWLVGVAALLLVVAGTLATSAVVGHATSPNGARMAAFLGSHLLYLGVVSAGVVAMTVWLRDVRSTLLALLALWVLGTAVVPRVSTALIGAALPLPSQDEFQASMQESREQGPDGHDPRDETLARLRADVLAQYGVQTVQELPIDIGGIMMQADEEYGNLVWDQHYGELQQQLEQQSRLATLAAAINPFQAIDVLSMASAGTDLTHDLSFQRQAESYRRTLVASLNDEHAHGRARVPGSRNSSASFFAAIEPFSYEPPALRDALQPRWSALATLALWAGGLLGLSLIGAKRLERGVLPC